MVAPKLRADFLLISLIALSPSFNDAVARESGFCGEYFKQRLHNKKGSEVLELAGLRYENGQYDSPHVNNVLNNLLYRGVLRERQSQEKITWGFELPPREYYSSIIAPSLDDKVRVKLEKFAKEFN